MTAALSARSVPTRKTWTVRRSDDVALQVWRVIANAGPRGIGASDARDRLNGMDMDLLKAQLRHLQSNAHVRFTGTNRWGAWVATGVLPADETAPVWLRNGDDEPADAADAAQPPATTADKVLAAARYVPCSVFALGGQVGSLGVDIDAVHMPAGHKAAMGAPADPVLAAALAIDRPSQAVPGDRIPNADLAEAPADPADAAMAPRDHFSLFTLGEGPLFALLSDHRLLVLRQSGDKLLFSPDETRALFRYLDGLMAIGYGSLSEATS